jgi:hypothetical protein
MRLWNAYVELVDERGIVLLEEACRMADRLDRLEALLSGDVEVWARLTHNLRTEDYELRIDSALVEARQQAATLRQILTTLPLKEAKPDDGDADDWLAGLDMPAPVLHPSGSELPDAGAAGR